MRGLCHQINQAQATGQVVPGPYDQAADDKSGVLVFAATNRALALFDSPANGAFTIIVAAI